MQKKPTRYSVMIFSDRTALPRRWTFAGRTFRLAVVLLAVLAVVFVYFSFHYGRTYDVWGHIEMLESEKQRLSDENAHYAARIENILAHQTAIEERIGKLATMVGVETLGDALSMGGAGGVTGGEAMVSEVGLPHEAGRAALGIEARQSLFNHNLDELEHIYREKTHLLNFIPSVWPVEGIITTGHGWRRDPFTGQPEFHAAVDISARTGTPIKAPADGIVASVGYSPGYGNTLVVSHGFGYVTRYAHLHAFNVKAGAKVKRGDIIGYVGSTGRSTGPHLHYEILLNSKAVNARNFVLEEIRRF